MAYFSKSERPELKRFSQNYIVTGSFARAEELLRARKIAFVTSELVFKFSPDINQRDRRVLCLSVLMGSSTPAGTGCADLHLIGSSVAANPSKQQYFHTVFPTDMETPGHKLLMNVSKLFTLF